MTFYKLLVALLLLLDVHVFTYLYGFDNFTIWPFLYIILRKRYTLCQTFIMIGKKEQYGTKSF